MDHGFFIHLSTDRDSGCFRLLVIVNDAAVNIGVLVFFPTDVSGFLGYILRSRIAGSNSSSIFNVLRKLQEFR